MGKHRRLAACAALAALTAAGCGGDPPVEGTSGEPQGECGVVESRFSGGSRAHVEECSDVDYEMSPPALGEHYPRWAAFGTYDFPLSPGFLVHNLEHGAVVFFYDCPDGCADEVAEVQAFIDALPVDPLCAADVRRRVILVPRPGLGARWAASAWGFTLTGSCFDAELFGAFYAAHVGQAPENLCNQGAPFASDPCL